MNGVADILLVGRHASLLASIAARLSGQSGFRVSGTLSPTAGCLTECDGLKVDLILADLDLAEAECLRLARRARSLLHGVPIVFITAGADDDSVRDAVAAGARGLLLKQTLPEALLPAIEEVLSGGTCYSEEIRRRLVVDSVGLRLTLAEGAG